MNEETFEYKTDNIEFLDHIDQHVTCQIPNNDPKLKKLVEDLQKHKCTHTCKKKGPDCRFGFPRLPSNRTLVTEPINKNNESEMEDYKEGKAILKQMAEK